MNNPSGRVNTPSITNKTSGNHLRQAFIAVTFVATALAVGGCNSSPGGMVGGSDTVNASLFVSHKDFLTKARRLEIGMTKDQAFGILKVDESKMTLLDRAQIKAAIYGGENTEFRGTYEGLEKIREFLRSLSGYRIDYKNIREDKSYSSLTSVKTHRQGHNYSVTLVFQDDKLFDRPIISGGPVNEKKSDPAIKNPTSLLLRLLF